MLLRSANIKINLVQSAICLALLFISNNSFAYGESGFSESTEMILKNLILKRIHDDPKVYKAAVQALIERELVIENKELDPKVVRQIIERILYAKTHISQPPTNPETSANLPKIIVFMTGAERQVYEKIQYLLKRGNKEEILQYYFNLEKNGDNWQFIKAPSGGEVDYSDVDVIIPVNQMARMDYPTNQFYKASFRIHHPPESWEFDESETHEALLVVNDINQIKLRVFKTGQKTVANKCDGSFNNIIKKFK